MLIFCENYICTMCTLAHLKVLGAAGQLHGRRVRPPPLQTAGRARPVLQDLDISLPARGVNNISVYLPFYSASCRNGNGNVTPEPVARSCQLNFGGVHSQLPQLLMIINYTFQSNLEAQ